MVIVNTVVIVRGLLGGTDADVAVVLAAYGAGSMAVAFLLPRLLERVSDRSVMLAGAWLLAAGTLVMAVILVQRRLPARLTAGLPLLLPVWFVLGAANSAVLTPTGRLLRRSAHAEDRPALFAAQFALSHACWLVAYPLAGWVGADGRRGGGFHGAGHSGRRGDDAGGLVLAGGRRGRGRACPYGLSGTNTSMSMTSTTSTPMRAGKGRNRTPILTGTRRSVTSTRWSSTGITSNGPAMAEVLGCFAWGCPGSRSWYMGV